MLSLVISVLIQLCIISTPSDFYNLPETQQQEYIEQIIDDEINNL